MAEPDTWQDCSIFSISDTYLSISYMLKTPVLFMIFNRPETTRRVFEEIRKAKPAKLFVAADGPRDDKPGEAELCRITRDIATQIDWECDIETSFRDNNLGCGVAIAENITWFFEHVEQGIIFEDDCLPHPSFFRYCEEMLAYYKYNPKVAQITGDNFQHGRKRGNASYYFSKYMHICGWATWRDRWQNFDYKLKKAPEYKRDKLIEQKCANPREQAFWHRKLDMLSGGKRKDIWDYQWMFACWNTGGLSAVSNVNLISNIGYDNHATHTINFDTRVANLPTFDIGPIIHTPEVVEDKKADYYTFFRSGAFFVPRLKDKIRWKIKALIPDTMKKMYKRISHNLP
jgi:hypothetical protein